MSPAADVLQLLGVPVHGINITEDNFLFKVFSFSPLISPPR